MDLMTLLRAQWDRVLAVTLAVAGLVFLIVGWYGVSGTAYFAEQMPYVVGNGLGGLFCLGVAAVLWLSADLQDEWRKLDLIEQALLAAPERQALAKEERSLGFAQDAPVEAAAPEALPSVPESPRRASRVRSPRPADS